ncbi:hypothetical protein BV25DRAFT_1841289 [Artomyces pyxidatus]|uniref:Uncharacterized protein n=1 Tax=Artomyces pyxidatus TaxID=48021 RepID=A0ACB8SNL2_9AGAM|nr:hypothetical protein BV25DRAFT_1841289 [Artomyces pyxidatus]
MTSASQQEWPEYIESRLFNFLHVTATVTDTTITVKTLDGRAVPIASSDPKFRDYVIRLLLNPAPDLKSLSLHIPPDYKPDSLFTTNMWAPPFNLREFRPALTELELRGAPFWTTADIALEVLRSLPKLQKLVLDDVIKLPNAPSRPLHSIPLPHLRHLELGLPSLESPGSFLDCLSFPPDVCFKAIHVGDAKDSAEDLIKLAAQLHAHIPKPMRTCLRFQSLSIDNVVDFTGQLLSGYGFTVSGPVLDNVALRVFPDQTPPLPENTAYDLVWDVEHDERGELLVRLLTPFVSRMAEGLQELTVAHMFAYSPKWWEALEPSVRTVRQIHTKGDAAAEGLLIALATYEEVVFPRLSVLIIEGLNFMEDMPSVKGTTFFAMLVRVLDQRTEDLFPVERVAIRGCDLTSSMIQSLRELAGTHEIEWDGNAGADLAILGDARSES